MPMMTCVNLPVKDLARTTEFFTKLGFSFDPATTDENATRMIISDDTSVMLQVEPFFKEFITPQEVVDTSRGREVISGLSTENREQVDDLANKAVAAGAQSTGISGRLSTWTCPRSPRADRCGAARRRPRDLGAVPCKCGLRSDDRQTDQLVPRPARSPACQRD